MAFADFYLVTKSELRKFIRKQKAKKFFNYVLMCNEDRLAVNSIYSIVFPLRILNNQYR